MTSQLFIEGRNGGRKTRAKSDAAWRCVEYPEAVPQITVATPHGAVRVTVSDDLSQVDVDLVQWRLEEDQPLVGRDELIYRGSIG